MRQQTKPFIVEIKQPRKLKTGNPKPSIWGDLDLSTAGDHVGPASAVIEPDTAESGDRL